MHSLGFLRASCQLPLICFLSLNRLQLVPHNALEPYQFLPTALVNEVGLCIVISDALMLSICSNVAARGHYDMSLTSTSLARRSVQSEGRHAASDHSATIRRILGRWRADLRKFRSTDGQNCDSQDCASRAASHGNKNGHKYIGQRLSLASTRQTAAWLIRRPPP